MWDKLERAEKRFIQIFSNMAAALLGLIMVFIILSVLDRSILKLGLYWTEEMARTCFIWFSLFAPAIMISSGTQFALDYFKEKIFKGRLSRDLWDLLLSLLMLMVSVVLIVNGLKYVYAMRNQSMPTIGAPIAVMYLSLPFGMTCITIMLLFLILRKVHDVALCLRAGPRGDEGPIKNKGE